MSSASRRGWRRAVRLGSVGRRATAAAAAAAARAAPDPRARTGGAAAAGSAARRAVSGTEKLVGLDRFHPRVVFVAAGATGAALAECPEPKPFRSQADAAGGRTTHKTGRRWPTPAGARVGSDGFERVFDGVHHPGAAGANGASERPEKVGVAANAADKSAVQREPGRLRRGHGGGGAAGSSGNGRANTRRQRRRPLRRAARRTAAPAEKARGRRGGQPVQEAQRRRGRVASAWGGGQSARGRHASARCQRTCRALARGRRTRRAGADAVVVPATRAGPRSFNAAGAGVGRPRPAGANKPPLNGAAGGPPQPRLRPQPNGDEKPGLSPSPPALQ
ncbi:MAG: hypothetical protein BJ554DRAFT_2739 [Olpidium bornovanus]|uniref:Uncharacterized protein n=1 Tax=Olpidium bornovanus TaxID=278681 RepID=A0A8H7ZQ02_9FUNG|nr:MAG: hypothetical protein BJ554DRAFT_2739 [Olpidium bornovanus]